MLTVACASDNGVDFSDSHFGDAAYYKIYTLGPDGYEHVEDMDNRTVEWEESRTPHGDPVKAKHVMMLLKDKNVQVVVNRRFGPNIARIKIRFLPVIVKEAAVEQAMERLKTRYSELVEEFDRGPDRKHIKL